MVLDLSRVPDIEYSALQMLIEGEARMAANGTVMWLAGLNPGVMKVVEHAGLAGEHLGHRAHGVQCPSRDRALSRDQGGLNRANPSRAKRTILEETQWLARPRGPFGLTPTPLPVRRRPFSCPCRPRPDRCR